MEKFQTWTIILSITSVFLLIMVIVGGGSTTYICYDGTEEENKNDCPAVPPLVISKKEADSTITTYSMAFARSRPGVSASVVNVYRENNSWKSDVAFSNSRTGDFNQVTFTIDGKTATVTCAAGCDYMAGNQSAPNETQTPTDSIIVSP